MNILLIGSGGREHALAWRLAQSPGLASGLDTLFAAPGNPGIARHATLAAIDVADADAVLGFARANAVGLVVVGPEAPLVAGLADVLRAGGIAVFGPSAAAARLEGSKGFTKDLCARAGIPTAAYVRVRDLSEAREALAAFGVPVVVKADGLAAGKGVTVATTAAEADAAVSAIFASEGAEAVIEEWLEGEEASLFVLSDGRAHAVLGDAQDHKRLGDGDTGPNTGGMGAYSPAPCLTPALRDEAMARIVEPTLRAMAAAGTPFSGVLYAGLMLTAAGPKLIEYNVRFGDPEAQVLMARFDGDLAELLLAVAEGRLADAPPPRLADAAACSVVIAAKGYPADPVAGGVIEGIADAEAQGVAVFHSGTRSDGDRLVAAGGRVLAVTAAADTIAAASDAVYAGVGRIRYHDGVWRRDIGARAVARDAGGR